MAQQPNDCDEKSWKRPWTTEEMRKNADKWNLAADAGLLKHLQQFSQVVLSHTHSTEKALDSLLETINTTNTNINNVTNDFLCLANTQFLESRVYDDDEGSPQEARTSDSNQAPVDGDVMTKVRSALSVGITLLDTMFDPLDQNASGVENDFMVGVRNRSPKNPYASRPLPHLIGSAAFMSDDNVGLVHQEREVEQPSPKAPTMDDLSMYSDESILTSSVKRNNMDDDSSNTSFCLGDETPIQSKKPPHDTVSATDLENDAVPEVKSFADELAGKLAGMVHPENKTPISSHREQNQEETIPRNRPTKTKGDMFGVPYSDEEEDDALFSGRSGLFSGGRGLFDDLDSRPVVPREATKDVSYASHTQPPPMSKVDSDLFGSNSADEENDDLFAVPAKQEPTAPYKPPDVPSRPLSIGDVISQAARRNANAPAPVPVGGAGDGNEKPAERAPTLLDFTPPPITQEKRIPVGGKSMFGSAGLAITKEALRRRPSTSSSAGSSDYGVKAPELAQESVGGRLPSSADEDNLFQPAAPVSHNKQSATRPITQNQNKEPKKSKSDFREISPESPPEDDLFAKPKSSADIFGRDVNSTADGGLFAKPKHSSDLFRSTEDDKSALDEDDLFAKPKSSSDIFKATENDKSATRAVKPKSSGGLFDTGGSSDEDNLFNPRPMAKQSQFSSVPPPLTKTEEKSKKVSLFDDSDSGDDEFLFSSASSAGSRRSQASVEIFNSTSASVPTDKAFLKKGLFDDGNLFSTSLDGPDIDIFRGVGNDSALPPSVTATGTSTAATKKNNSSAVSGASTVITSGANPPDGAASTVTDTVSNSTRATASVPRLSSSGVAPIGSAISTAADPLPGASSANVSSGAGIPPSGAVPAGASTGSTISGSSVPPSSASSVGAFTVSGVPPSDTASVGGSTSSTTSGTGVPPSPPSFAGVPTRATIPDSNVPPTKLPNPNPNTTISDLFDDDEDLFSVSSNPPVHAKPIIKDIAPPNNSNTSTSTGNLFSGLENETKSIHSLSGDLFDDIPEDDLFPDKFTPSMGSPPLKDEPKSRVDALFGTDESDGDIFVPRKPTLTISDSSVENEKSEAKVQIPPKSVPNKPESIIGTKSDTKPETPIRPPTTLDIRNTTDPSVISSFDDEDDDDDDDLFKSLPAETAPPVQPAKLSGSLPKNEERPKPTECDVPVIVVEPKTVPISVEKTPKPVPAARKSNTPCEEKLVVESSRPPEVLPKPTARTSAKTDEISVLPEDNVSPEDPPPVQKRTPLAGFALNINPLALLPGAQPPSKKTPGEEPVGFDQPMEKTSTLHSAQKDRVRVSRRRPPSRRARQEAAKVVDHTVASITSPSSALSPSTDEDDLFGVPQDLPSDSGPFDGPHGPFDGAPILSPAEPLVTLPDQVDSTTVDDPLLKMRSETVSETEADTDVAEDHSSLFAFVKKKPKEAQPEALFSQAPLLPTKDDVERGDDDSTGDDFDNDGLFKPSASVKKITDIGSGTKMWNLSDDDDDEDLFSTGMSSSKPRLVNSSDTTCKEVEEEEEEEKIMHRREPPPISKGPMRQSALKETARALFDDDDDDDDDQDDDLFSCSANKPPPLPVSKVSAGATKKSSNIQQFKDDLFDDPLSGR